MLCRLCGYLKKKEEEEEEVEEEGRRRKKKERINGFSEGDVMGD